MSMVFSWSRQRTGMPILSYRLRAVFCVHTPDRRYEILFLQNPTKIGIMLPSTSDRKLSEVAYTHEAFFRIFVRIGFIPFVRRLSAVQASWWYAATLSLYGRASFKNLLADFRCARAYLELMWKSFVIPAKAGGLDVQTLRLDICLRRGDEGMSTPILNTL